MRTEVEKDNDEAPKVRVRLKNVASYHNLEADEVKRDGDVVEVVAGRATALVSQGYAEPVGKKSSADEPVERQRDPGPPPLDSSRRPSPGRWPSKPKARP